MRVWEPYCVATEHNEHMHFTSLRLLRQCCYNVLLRTNEYEGVRTLLCRYWTQWTHVLHFLASPTSVLLQCVITLMKVTCAWARRSFCLLHKETKRSTEAKLTASASYEVWFERCGICLMCCWEHHKYYTLPLCNGDTRLTRAYVARLYPMVSVLCLTWHSVSQATLASETMKTRDSGRAQTCSGTFDHCQPPQKYTSSRNKA